MKRKELLVLDRSRRYTAEEAWDKLISGQVKLMKHPEYIGCFYKAGPIIYYNCGEEYCCDWDYETKKEFVSAFSDDTEPNFRIYE